MHLTRRSLPPALLTIPLTLSVVSALLATAPASAVTDDSAKPQVVADVDQGARQTLEDARDLFDEDGAQPGRDATMVLRELVLARDSLTGTERREADRILARPTDGPMDPNGYQTGVTVEKSCATVCVHWVESSADAVDTTDASGNGRSDYVDAVVATMEDVHAKFVAAGYRAPKPDGVLGGNALPDIYLANIGDENLYGYCTTDDTTVPPTGPFDAWAYCVLDNDFSPAEFPTNTPLENMQVTAAHEYFHAVQFGYDLLEDPWFMEATATWVEDEMYDDVDDNLSYLETGPLAHPSAPLDTYGDGFHYGTWIFFRYLTEQLPAEVGGLPSLVRDMWALTDGSSAGPDQYSMQAVATVLKQRGTSLQAMFAAFADANRRPRATYSEGAVNSYPASPHGAFAAKNGWFVTKLDHMSSATGRFVAEKKKFTKLKVSLDLAPRSAGSAALVTVTSAGGTTKTTKFPLDRKGNGTKSYPFAPKSVKSVEVTLVNASAKYSCWQQAGPFSCHGFAQHDDLTAKIRGVLVR